jgi:hypothetical protein
VADETDWHGWVNGDEALFISALEDGRIALWTQQGRDVEPVALFTDSESARRVMSWMDDTIAETGRINAELVAQLSQSQGSGGTTSQ